MTPTGQAAEPVRGAEGDPACVGDLWAWERTRDGALWDAWEGKWTRDPLAATPYPGRYPRGTSMSPLGYPAGCVAGTAAEDWVPLRDVLGRPRSKRERAPTPPRGGL